MSSFAAGHASDLRSTSPQSVASTQIKLRVLLLAGCVGSVAAVAWLGEPAHYLAADPELARLLRGMALIKAAIVAVAVAAVLWRFSKPVSPRAAAVYLGGMWLLAAASMMIWQLTLIPAAAIGFHVAELALLWVAWGDRGVMRAVAPCRK